MAKGGQMQGMPGLAAAALVPLTCQGHQAGSSSALQHEAAAIQLRLTPASLCENLQFSTISVSEPSMEIAPPPWPAAATSQAGATGISDQSQQIKEWEEVGEGGSRTACSSSRHSSLHRTRPFPTTTTAAAAHLPCCPRRSSPAAC